jgi:phosphoesterase RecJ-like protein
MNDIYGKVVGVLKSAHDIAVFMHINPDCDCIGSAIALCTFLNNAGKNASFFSPDLTTTDGIGEKYEFLPHFDKFNAADTEQFDLSVGVDVGDAGRLGDAAYRKFAKSKCNLVIDHHEIHEDFAQLNLRESGAASTTQILWKIMKLYGKQYVDKDVATLLYAGLVSDSGGFSYECTTAETHATAAELLPYGINNSRISEILLKDITRNVFVLKNRVLSAAKFYENGRIGIMVFRQSDFNDTGTTEKDTDGLITSLQNVINVDLAISIAEVGDKKFKLSFRSKNDVNAAACAKCFGGGGHYRAAGCRIFGNFDEVYERVIAVSREMVNND